MVLVFASWQPMVTQIIGLYLTLVGMINLTLFSAGGCCKERGYTYLFIKCRTLVIIGFGLVLFLFVLGEIGSSLYLFYIIPHVCQSAEYHSVPSVERRHTGKLLLIHLLMIHNTSSVSVAI